MQFHNDFDSIIASLAARSERARVAVVCPHDEHTCEAVADAIKASLADFVLVGDPARIPFAADEHVSIVNILDNDAACAAAVALAREGKVDVLMKGLVNTDNLLRAILNKETGILPRGTVMSHITAAQIPGRHKLLLFSDACVIPFPNDEQFAAITGYLIDTLRTLGVEQPRVALTHCTEKTSPKFPITLSYAMLKEQCAAGAMGNAIVDGPMDVKTALDPESGAIKGIVSPVNGDADAIVFPDIEAGNTFYKTISWLAHATMAGMIVGTQVPVVLPSRGDSSRSKLCSLALAISVARR